MKFNSDSTVNCAKTVSYTNCNELRTALFNQEGEPSHAYRFITDTVNSSLRFGIFATANSSYIGDWLSVNVPTPSNWSDLVKDSGDSGDSCSYLVGFRFTTHWSYAQTTTNPANYVMKIVAESIYEKLPSSSPANSSVPFRHEFNYKYHEPPLSSYVRSRESNPYGTGIGGALNYFFTEVLIPILKPSGVQNN